MHTLEVFEKDPACTENVLAVKPRSMSKCRRRPKSFWHYESDWIRRRGSERQYSVAACLKAHVTGGIVLVHDAARPFIRQFVIDELVSTAAKFGAAIAGVKPKDTMKFAPVGIVEETVDRDKLWIIQTPQAFSFDVLKEAFNKAKADDFLGTDESMLVERMGHPVRIVESTYDNVKMTTTEDLVFGEILLRRRQQEDEK